MTPRQGARSTQPVVPATRKRTRPAAFLRRLPRKSQSLLTRRTLIAGFLAPLSAPPAPTGTRRDSALAHSQLTAGWQRSETDRSAPSDRRRVTSRGDKAPQIEIAPRPCFWLLCSSRSQPASLELHLAFDDTHFARTPCRRSPPIAKQRVRSRPGAPTVGPGHDAQRPANFRSAVRRNTGARAGTRRLRPWRLPAL